MYKTKPYFILRNYVTYTLKKINFKLNLNYRTDLNTRKLKCSYVNFNDERIPKFHFRRQRLN